MVETRLAHSASRSGSNNVELSPVGDYRRGGCLLARDYHTTLITHTTLIASHTHMFVTLINKTPTFWAFTSSVLESS